MPSSTATDAPTPRRRTLVDEAERVLRDWLASGQHRKGDRLPPEHELAGRLGVSRGTLRAALERLEETSEVVRRQGSGTYVGEIGRLRTFSEGLERLASYTRLARIRGIELRATAVEVERAPLNEELATLFDVEPGIEATSCARLLLANGEPAALMHDVIHPDVTLPAKAELLSLLRRGAMLLDILLELGLPIAYSRTRIRAHGISPEDERGKSLGVTDFTAVLELEETMHASDGGVVQRASDLFAPTTIDLHVIRRLDRGQPEPLNRLTSS